MRIFRRSSGSFEPKSNKHGFVNGQEPVRNVDFDGGQRSHKCVVSSDLDPKHFERRESETPTEASDESYPPSSNINKGMGHLNPAHDGPQSISSNHDVLRQSPGSRRKVVVRRRNSLSSSQELASSLYGNSEPAPPVVDENSEPFSGSNAKMVKKPSIVRRLSGSAASTLGSVSPRRIAKSVGQSNPSHDGSQSPSSNHHVLRQSPDSRRNVPVIRRNSLSSSEELANSLYGNSEPVPPVVEDNSEPLPGSDSKMARKPSMVRRLSGSAASTLGSLSPRRTAKGGADFLSPKKRHASIHRSSGSIALAIPPSPGMAGPQPTRRSSLGPGCDSRIAHGIALAQKQKEELPRPPMHPLTSTGTTPTATSPRGRRMRQRKNSLTTKPTRIQRQASISTVSGGGDSEEFLQLNFAEVV